MALEDSIIEFTNRCKKLNDVIDLFSKKYDTLETKYNRVLEFLWSAESEINLLKTNLEQLSITNERTTAILKVLEEVIDRIDNIEEIIKNIEIEFSL
ncbi:MAG TPA: hypothetical protein PLX23_12690 [Candidatus Hydrogenedens sp.]|nr:hypothetical protein [Candidatus Hydrogenedens sp.]